MGRIRSCKRVSNGGGGGQTLAWALQTIGINFAWTAGGLALNLTNTPVSEEAIIVWSQGLPLSPDDWTLGPGTIVIDFAADPAVDNPETGIWQFFIQYPYVV